MPTGLSRKKSGQSRVIPECCPGYVYNDSLKQCVAFVGWFGTICSQSCPQGYYGRKCLETCSCDIALYDVVLGCLVSASDSDTDVRALLGLFQHLALSVLAIAIVVLMIILLRVIYRLKIRTRTRFGDDNSTRSGTNYEGILASSLVRYSDVGYPMMSPELIVEQKDVIYVNMMTLQELNKGKDRMGVGDNFCVYDQNWTL